MPSPFHSGFTVVYDSCVLYPAPLRDLLLQLATTGLFRARWTDDIHREWIENLLEDRPDLDRKRLERTRARMDSIRGCLVSGYQALIPTLELPDPDDRHVLAAAITVQADAIVTCNLDDFPAWALSAHQLTALHPDDFLMDAIPPAPAKRPRRTDPTNCPRCGKPKVFCQLAS